MVIVYRKGYNVGMAITEHFIILRRLIAVECVMLVTNENKLLQMFVITKNRITFVLD